MNDSVELHLIRDYLLGLQNRIVTALSEFDSAPFTTDRWQRGPGEPLQGDGQSRVIEHGGCFERGGVNFSQVRGDALPPSATVMRPQLAGQSFEALGVSLVLHPYNPYCPTVHMNVRFLVATPSNGSPLTEPGLAHSPAGGGAPNNLLSAPSRLVSGAVRKSYEPLFWFGGGMDLTPYYGFDDDAIHFHRVCRDALAPFGEQLYPRFKRSCDEYFFLKHRNEPRGIGGIFYDDFCELGFARSFEMMRSVGDAFLNAYLPILARRRGMPFGARERDFQAYRRGRYVEFNLLSDRGTLFGLQSGGRTESILVSMPPVVHWRYDWQPEPGTPEARLYKHFLVPREWL